MYLRRRFCFKTPSLPSPIGRAQMGEGDQHEVFEVYGVEDQDGFGAGEGEEELFPQAAAGT